MCLSIPGVNVTESQRGLSCSSRSNRNLLYSGIEAGKIDCVVVYKVDRLSRLLSDSAKTVEVFDKQKVVFVSATQQFNTSTSARCLVLKVLLSFAQFEREIIRDKIAAQRRKGKWAGGSPVLGYDVDRAGVSGRIGPKGGL
ncbi:MAG: recombinase family protein [Thermoguttaceae bacterium]